MKKWLINIIECKVFIFFKLLIKCSYLGLDRLVFYFICFVDFLFYNIEG